MSETLSITIEITPEQLEAVQTLYGEFCHTWDNYLVWQDEDRKVEGLKRPQLKATTDLLNQIALRGHLAQVHSQPEQTKQDKEPSPSDEDEDRLLAAFAVLDEEMSDTIEVLSFGMRLEHDEVAGLIEDMFGVYREHLFGSDCEEEEGE